MKDMTISRIFVFIALVITAGLLISPVSAFDTRSGDNIVISEPVDDDILASGGSMIVNAPVKSITWAGGTLIVNEPVKENLVAVGGTIQLNAPVGTDIFVIGGNIEINSDVGGKVMALGGSVTMSGDTENIAAAGGTVILGKETVISRDAIISASGYTTQATILGNLTIEEGTGEETGFDLEMIGSVIQAFITIAMIISFFGFLILGIVFVKICPAFHAAIVKTGKEKLLLSFIAGIAGLIVGFILFLILLVTMVGIPLAFLLLFLMLIGLMLANILTGALAGEWIQKIANKEVGLIWGFVIGFVIINILFLIPFIGFMIWIVSVFLGFGMPVLTCDDAYSNTGA
ncbi:MAG TPA: hypothetical protein PKX11_09030 [Methanospirillum sp.]|nr:hypothetical protein [Methanospirillum sp.]